MKKRIVILGAGFAGLELSTTLSEALGEIMGWFQLQPDVHRVWAYCAVDHVRSARVLERSGMTYEGTLRRWVVLPNLADEPTDARVFSWVREDARGRS